MVVGRRSLPFGSRHLFRCELLVSGSVIAKAQKWRETNSWYKPLTNMAGYFWGDIHLRELQLPSTNLFLAYFPSRFCDPMPRALPGVVYHGLPSLHLHSNSQQLWSKPRGLITVRKTNGLPLTNMVGRNTTFLLGYVQEGAVIFREGLLPSCMGILRSYDKDTVDTQWNAGGGRCE